MDNPTEGYLHPNSYPHSEGLCVGKSSATFQVFPGTLCTARAIPYRLKWKPTFQNLERFKIKPVLPFCEMPTFTFGCAYFWVRLLWDAPACGCACHWLSLLWGALAFGRACFGKRLAFGASAFGCAVLWVRLVLGAPALGAPALERPHSHAAGQAGSSWLLLATQSCSRPG